MTEPIAAHPLGAQIRVRAQPGASRAAIVGRHGDELKIRVCSPPQDGRANDELRVVLADALGVRPREVALVAGHTARSKVVVVPLLPAEVAAALARWIGPDAALGR